jgi:hypothetical protein
MIEGVDRVILTPKARGGGGNKPLPSFALNGYNAIEMDRDTENLQTTKRRICCTYSSKILNIFRLDVSD